MKSFFRMLRSKFIWLKVMFGRSIAYVSMLNAGMILFLFLAKLKESGYIHFDLQNYSIILYILSFVVFTLLGYIEWTWLRGYSEEVNVVNASTPLHPGIQKIKEDVEVIRKRLDEMEMTKNG